VFGAEPPGVGKVDALVDSDPDYFAPWKRMTTPTHYVVPDAAARELHDIQDQLGKIGVRLERMRTAKK
jgi:hypothetical protein